MSEIGQLVSVIAIILVLGFMHQTLKEILAELRKGKP